MQPRLAVCKLHALTVSFYWHCLASQIVEDLKGRLSSCMSVVQHSKNTTHEQEPAADSNLTPEIYKELQHLRDRIDDLRERRAQLVEQEERERMQQ